MKFLTSCYKLNLRSTAHEYPSECYWLSHHNALVSLSLLKYIWTSRYCLFFSPVRLAVGRPSYFGSQCSLLFYKDWGSDLPVMSPLRMAPLAHHTWNRVSSPRSPAKVFIIHQSYWYSRCSAYFWLSCCRLLLRCALFAAEMWFQWQRIVTLNIVQNDEYFLGLRGVWARLPMSDCYLLSGRRRDNNSWIAAHFMIAIPRLPPLSTFIII